ncbi:endopolyphosphatase [Athelia psychrophila]|uniref:Endopolyphosphatase n=1 Tax=Athelia psychrophila TaxID=1759441 RepID=A0A166FXB2_9AGAM|nr:endopolyphosphatase [Fibularhizoctonia sp. CBS 109695]
MRAQTLLVLFAVAGGALAAPLQAPFEVPSTLVKRKLNGRFLHITDMHPDPYYTPRTSVKKSCHRKKPKKKGDEAGYYGTPHGDCDSPLRLTNFTLDFLEKHWASEIDFVIWTGDNARHDEDNKIPRTPAEIYDTNRAVASKMKSIFSARGIPVVPSLGNNDVWLQNILTPGPNTVTNTYSSIWGSFIPFPSYQVFQRGAYYSTEVVPDAIGVISLNTLYFYDSNKAVGGCEYTDPEDAGNLQFDWLQVQLESFRNRNMQVWVTGHVPPSSGTYYPECYVRYAELSLRFQDTILGHLFGHLNADHFHFIEANDLNIWAEPAKAMSPSGLFEGIIETFENIPKESKIDYDDYGVVNVSPSVVPNPYLPSFRIFSYNITDAGSQMMRPSDSKLRVHTTKDRTPRHRSGRAGDKKKLCKLKEYRDTWKCQLREAWHSDEEAPSRQNKLWSPLGYAQYYLPNLDSADKRHDPKYNLEYMTFRPQDLHPHDNETALNFHYPVPLRNLPRSLRNDTITKSTYAPYCMRDLTVSSWITLARKFADPKRKKLRKLFKKFMFMGGEEG